MSLGKEAPTGEVPPHLRGKKLHKEFKRWQATPAYKQPSLPDNNSKNDLSSYKMNVSTNLIDYITRLEQNIAQTKTDIQQEQQGVVNLIKNVSYFLRLEGISQQEIFEVLQKVRVDQTELEQFQPQYKSDWFEMLQENRFKTYLYGGSVEEKLTPEQFNAASPTQQKKKFKKVVHDLVETKKRKKVIEYKKAPHVPVTSQTRESDLTNILKDVLKGQEFDMNIIGGFQKYINTDLTLKGPAQPLEHISKGE